MSHHIEEPLGKLYPIWGGSLQTLKSYFFGCYYSKAFLGEGPGWHISVSTSRPYWFPDKRPGGQEHWAGIMRLDMSSRCFAILLPFLTLNVLLKGIIFYSTISLSME